MGNSWKIDPEIRALISPLRPEELEQLEENIKQEGKCRDAGIVWKGEGILLDGHNRADICKRLGIDFRVTEKAFANREAALAWIDDNQLGRRNLSSDQLSLLRGRRYNRMKLNNGGDRIPDIQNEYLVDHNTSTHVELAKRLLVSPSTIQRDGKFAESVEKVKAVDPDIEKKIAAGDAPPKATIIKAAKAETKKEAKAILSGKKKNDEVEVFYDDAKPPKKVEPKVVEKDQVGNDITEPAIAALFGRRHELQESITAISRLKSHVLNAIEKKDPLYSQITASQFQADCSNIHRTLRFAMPHAICPYCDGDGGLNKNCKACKGSGWLTELQYKAVPSEMK